MDTKYDKIQPTWIVKSSHISNALEHIVELSFPSKIQPLEYARAQFSIGSGPLRQLQVCSIGSQYQISRIRQRIMDSFKRSISGICWECC
jgi:hypothetical protein